MFNSFKSLVAFLVFIAATFDQTAYSGDSGTEDDPWQIVTTDDLIALSGTAGDWDKHFIQTTDEISTKYINDNKKGENK